MSKTNVKHSEAVDGVINDLRSLPTFTLIAQEVEGIDIKAKINDTTCYFQVLKSKSTSPHNAMQLPKWEEVGKDIAHFFIAVVYEDKEGNITYYYYTPSQFKALTRKIQLMVYCGIDKQYALTNINLDKRLRDNGSNGETKDEIDKLTEWITLLKTEDNNLNK